jgi:hypothetical protein
MLGNGDLDDGIPEELEALVVKRVIFALQRDAWVSQGLGEQ